MSHAPGTMSGMLGTAQPPKEWLRTVDEVIGEPEALSSGAYAAYAAYAAASAAASAANVAAHAYNAADAARSTSLIRSADLTRSVISWSDVKLHFPKK